MSLSDELAELRKPVIACSVCRWYSEQSPSDRAEFDACVTAEHVPMNALLKVCRGHGLEISDSTFRTHLHEHHSKDAP